MQEFLDGVEPFLSSPADRVTVRASVAWKVLRELQQLRRKVLEQDQRILELLLLQAIDEHLEETVPLVGPGADLPLDVPDEWLEEGDLEPDRPEETPTRPFRRLAGDPAAGPAASPRCHTGEWLRPSPPEVEEFDPARDD